MNFGIRVTPLLFGILYLSYFDYFLHTPELLNANQEQASEFSNVIKSIFLLLLGYPIPIIIARSLYRIQTLKISTKLNAYLNSQEEMGEHEKMNYLINLISLDHTFFNAERAMLNINVFNELTLLRDNHESILFADLATYYQKMFSKTKNNIIALKQLSYRPILRVKEKDFKISFRKSIQIKKWLLDEIQNIKSA